jgi:hypothetical protein
LRTGFRAVLPAGAGLRIAERQWIAEIIEEAEARLRISFRRIDLTPIL